MDIFFNKKHPLNFKSLLIVTYGRSGSTLLMGVLNSIDGVAIRGENHDFCYHLYSAYKSLLASKSKNGTKQDPFFGAEFMDEQQLINDFSKVVKKMLLPNLQNKAPLSLLKNLKSQFRDQKNIFDEIQCYGFKEVRYDRHLNEFAEYLSFLEKIFPDVCFIFNTRNKEDVLKSMKAVDFYTEKPFDIDFLSKIETAFFDFIKTHPNNTFHIRYQDVIGKTKKLEELFSFLGAPFNDQKIQKVLSFRHSYAPNQEDVKKLPYHSS